jgi:tripartite-type tricarboxylate transporter receptor subunit TctC
MAAPSHREAALPPPDGYTLLVVDNSPAINASVYDKLNFNFIRDIAPVASIARVGYVMEVSPSVPAKTVPEFIAYTKANPGKLNMASAGIGGGPHLCGELFKMITGINLEAGCRVPGGECAKPHGPRLPVRVNCGHGSLFQGRLNPV